MKKIIKLEKNRLVPKMFLKKTRSIGDTNRIIEFESNDGSFISIKRF